MEEGGVVRADLHRLQGHGRALRQSLIEAGDAAPAGQRQAEFRHHLFHVPDREVDQRATPPAQHVAQAGQHHMLHLRAVDHLRERLGEVLEHDDRFGAGVLELVFQLARRVQRVHVHHGVARAQDSGNGDRVLEHVGHHHRDAGALLHAAALQPGGEEFGIGVQLRVGHELVHAHVRVAVGVLAEGLFEHLHQ